LKPISDKTQHVRAKGGRSNGGTRYYSGKFRDEDKMVGLMQKALNEKIYVSETYGDLKTYFEEQLSVDDLIFILKLSYEQTERMLRKAEKRCFQNKK
jgi:hypothetical protein